MQHWVYVGIHLYLHLPAIYAYAYTNSNPGTQIYADPAASPYPSTAPIAGGFLVLHATNR